MANMSYCRFENTLTDLHDCLNHIDDELESETEKKARKKLVKLCQRIIDGYDAENCGDDE